MEMWKRGRKRETGHINEQGKARQGWAGLAVKVI